jgi:hypothetical protein
MARLWRSIVVLAMMTVLVVPTAGANHLPPLEERNFGAVVGPGGAAPQGFGDRENTWAWSMAWFKGKLYVGANRAHRCVEARIWHRGVPLIVPATPVPNDIDCPPTLPQLLPHLRAEIWEWTPETNQWKRVYQSPLSVTNPENKQPNTVPADIGFRGMTVFKEADGTEALYVGGVSAKPLFGRLIGANMPPQRLLRSTDGAVFSPVSQNPGTVLGDPKGACFRGMTTFRNKMLLLACNIQGSGQLYASEHPELGDDNFEQITPDSITVFEFAPYRDQIYIGTHNRSRGYSVLKTAATGASVPYTFQTVVEPGAGVRSGDRPNTDALSMFEFNGRLYVGGNGMGRTTSSELIRINPDNTWDLVAGIPRNTSQGPKTPLSGLTGGFGNHFNQHFWRMAVHDGTLHVGTLDTSTAWRYYAPLEPQIKHLYGFDLWSTRNGWYLSSVTTDGFGDEFAYGGRTFASHPDLGLFLGTANPWTGLRVMRGIPAQPEIAAPQRVEAEVGPAGRVISWEPVQGASRYHVLRLGLKKIEVPNWPFPMVSRPSGSGLPILNAPITEGIQAGILEILRGVTQSLLTSTIEVTIPEPLNETPIASPTTTSYVDATALNDPYAAYQYMVVAESATGKTSALSNVAQAPSPTPPMTLKVLDTFVDGLEARGVVGQNSPARQFVNETTALLPNNVDGAIARTQAFRQQLGGLFPSAPTVKEDLEIMSAKLLRRLSLAKEGKLSPASVLQ